MQDRLGPIDGYSVLVRHGSELGGLNQPSQNTVRLN